MSIAVFLKTEAGSPSSNHLPRTASPGAGPPRCSAISTSADSKAGAGAISASGAGAKAAGAREEGVYAAGGGGETSPREGPTDRPTSTSAASARGSGSV